MTYKVAKVILFPKSEALKYEKYILKRLRFTIALINKRLKPFFAKNKISDYRADDYVDDLQELLQDVAEFMNFSQNSLIGDLIQYGRSLLGYSKKQLFNSLKDIINIEVAAPSIAVNVFQNPLLDKNIDLMLKSWVSTNTSLITSIQSDLLEQVSVIVESSYRSGLSMQSLSKKLQSRFNISKNRAKLIARDQTGKLHSDYIKHEHGILGIKEYVWLTANESDENNRVRPSHKVLNNKICQWDNATTYKNKEEDKLKSKTSIGGVLLQVGQDYQCRCSLAAIIKL